MFVLFVSLLGSVLGKYASYILGAMGIALLLMLFEPIQLILKRRSVLQDIKRLKRLDQRRSQTNNQSNNQGKSI